jgi:hypothetical protein
MFSPDVELAQTGSIEQENSGIRDLGSSRTGSEDFASWRAEVYLMARHVLQDFARERHWSIDCSGLETLYTESSLVGDLEDVPLDGQSKLEVKIAKGLPSQHSSSSGISSISLRKATKSEENLRTAYEQFTDLTLRHFLVANRTRSAERAFADMAVLKYRALDFASAASYFHQVVPFYRGTHWKFLEGTMLELYAHCLKRLGRKEDYVQVLLKMLPKYVTETMPTFQRDHFKGGTNNTDLAIQGSRSLQLVDNYIHDLLLYSQELSKEISAPLEDFFAGLEIEPRIWHSEGNDGFQMRFKMRSLLGNEMQLQKKIRIRLLECADVQPREIWLESREDLVVSSVSTTIAVHSNVSAIFCLVDTCSRLAGFRERKLLDRQD